MVCGVSFDIDYIASDPPVKLFACDYYLVQGACVIHVPFGIEAKMSRVCDVLVVVLLNLHLLYCMSLFKTAYQV